jgi:hypothetical protein
MTRCSPMDMKRAFHAHGPFSSACVSGTAAPDGGRVLLDAAVLRSFRQRAAVKCDCHLRGRRLF